MMHVWKFVLVQDSLQVFGKIHVCSIQCLNISKCYSGSSRPRVHVGGLKIMCV